MNKKHHYLFGVERQPQKISDALLCQNFIVPEPPTNAPETVRQNLNVPQAISKLMQKTQSSPSI